MPVQPQPDDIKGWWAVFAGAGGFLVGVGSFIHKVRTHGARLVKAEKAVVDLADEMKKLSSEMKRRLYDENSMPIFTPMIQCRECRVDCEATRAKEMKGLNKKLDKLLEIHLKDGE